MKYIDAEKMIAKIEGLLKLAQYKEDHEGDFFFSGEVQGYENIITIITSLQQEQPEVDLKKLGEIARHLIAVKDHEEDMRLDESEWLLLERIGYPERFNARKEE